jgi:pilus assembly protein CpaF
MGLHDRLSKQNGNGAAGVTAERPAASAGPVAYPAQPHSPASTLGASDPYAELKSGIHHAVIAKLGPELFKRETGEDLSERVLHAVTEQLALDRTPLTREERRRIVREIADDVLGYGPLEPLLRDDSVTEVMVNNHDRIFVEREGRLERTDASFVDNAHLLRIIDKIVSQVGRRIDESSPMVDARLPDGSRVNAIIPPLSLRGPTLTIRKFSRDPYTMDDLINFNSLTPQAAQFLAACVKGKLNVLISGGTGSGKTTMLNALSSFVPGDERIVTIEDVLELRLRQPHVVRLEARPASVEGRGEVTIRHLVRNALRMRPDRIVVGEVRGGEALDMLAAMTTGHDGSLSTVHAGSPEEALRRLETLALMAGVGLPHAAIREQVADALDLVVHQARLADGTRRVVAVAEVVRVAGGPATRELFGWHAGRPRWRAALSDELAARLAA